MGKLEVTPHADLRMWERKVTRDDVLNAIRRGERTPSGALVLHHDKRTGIVAVVNWRELRLITVKRR